MWRPALHSLSAVQEKRWHHGNSVCVWQGEPSTGVRNLAVILRGQSLAVRLDQSAEGMPTGLTGWPTSVPSRLLNDRVWYLTLWEWPGVTAAIPDISVKGSCLSILHLLPFFFLREWESYRNVRGEGRWSWQASGNHCHKTPRAFTATHKYPWNWISPILSHYSLHSINPTIHSDSSLHKHAALT